MTALRPLLLAFWAPPAIRPQSVLLRKMLPEWLRQGVRPVTVTYDGGGWDIDLPFVGIPSPPDLGRWVHLPLATVATDIVYARRVVRQLEPLIAKHDINVIYSFANPRQSNVVGALLAERTGVPYVAHFSDPWYGTTHRRPLSTLPLELAALERYTVRHADQVTVVDDRMLAFIMGKYPPPQRAKGSVVPHCFDPALYPEVAPRQDGAFEIAHTGILYRKRTPETLFDAMQRMMQKRPDVAARVRARFIGAFGSYGNFNRTDLDDLRRRYDVREERVIVEPPMEFTASLAAMRRADCLLAIDPRETYFIASKIIDYAGADRPIVAIAPPDSPSAAVVSGLGFRSFSHDDAAGLSTHLIAMADGAATSTPNAGYRDQFHVRNTTAKLFAVLKAAVGRRRIAFPH